MIAVTGATGLIGRRLVELLGERGHDVVAVARNITSLPSGLATRTLDVTDRDAVRRALAELKPKVIVHLAGMVTGARQIDQVLPNLQTNLLGTIYVLMAAREIGCERVVLSGTLLQDPTVADGHPIPPSPYGASKWAADAYARMFDALFGLPVVILRPSMVYGPGQRDLTKVIPYVISTTLRGELPQLTSGDWEVDWLYVDDAAAAFVAAVERSGLDGLTIDLGSGQRATVRNIVERLMVLLGAPRQARFGALEDRPHEASRPIDVERTRRLLDWTPAVGIDAGLARTVRWFARGQGAAR